MSSKGLTPQQRTIGQIAAWAVCLGLVLYAVVLTLGLLSLQSPQDPIGDPYFSLMEILLILIAPLMLVTMVVVHAYALPAESVYTISALGFMIIMTGITCSVHFVILTVSRQISATDLPWVPLFLSFTWPSIIYTLDILAWDFFFALAMLFAAPVFWGSPLKRAVRYLLLAAGIFSLVGLIGVPLADMNIRNIGIIGYVPIAAIMFLVLGFVFKRDTHAEQTLVKP